MPPLTAPDDALLSTFGRLVEAHSRLATQLGLSLQQRTGLPLAWFEVLLRISRSDGGQVRMGVLAQEVALTTGGVTKLIDRMSEAGLVERVPCPTDRRVSFAVLTPQGATALGRAADVHVSDLRQAFDGFSQQDLEELDDLLDRLRVATI